MTKAGERLIRAANQARQMAKLQIADRWKHCPSTHCERSGECRSPHDCAANLEKAKIAEGGG